MPSAYRKKHSTETALLRVWSDMLQILGKLLCLASWTSPQRLTVSSQSSTAAAGARLRFGWCAAVDPFILVRSYTVSCLRRPTVYNLTTVVRRSTRLHSGAIIVHFIHCRTRTCGHTAWHASTPVCWYSQLYPHVTVSNTVVAVQCSAACVSNVNDWMRARRLRLNPAKTEVMWSGS